ncbi:MAG: hypothetical protein KBF82_01575 [Chitinophagaceae bacterium]|nr:hypothetical protein [Chitinophagaceae bacterium]
MFEKLYPQYKINVCGTAFELLDGHGFIAMKRMQSPTLFCKLYWPY